jgi:hypothetical protein
MNDLPNDGKQPVAIWKPLKTFGHTFEEGRPQVMVEK